MSLCSSILHIESSDSCSLARLTLCSCVQVLRDAKKKHAAVVANEAEALTLLVAHDLALKKMYNNVACLGGGPLYCTIVGGDEK